MLNRETPSRLGDVYLTEDATAQGTPVAAEWVNFDDMRAVCSSVHAADGTEHFQISPVALNVPIKIRITGCPPALHEALVREYGKGPFNGTLLYVQKKYDDTEQTVSWDIYDTEWVDLTPRDGYMPADVVVRLLTYTKQLG
jgi:hypothetical protein